MAEVSGTKIASFRGDIEDLRNNTIDRATFNAARNEIVDLIGEAETKKLERRLRTELSQGSNDLGKSRGGMAKKKGPMQMAMGGMANGRQHMYLSRGALVTDNLNPGLKALAKKRPDVVKKILGK
jgi:hypothetical protein|tara:strand:- start:126 stop:500 length:375 start_codon:yes stop_codon:yes gene_type:complete